MAVGCRTILNQVQRVTLEGAGDDGATWPSGMWTQAEVLGYLNQRQNRLLAACGILWKRAETNITISQANQAQPSDWVRTVFVAYKTGAGLYRELPKLSSGELDLWLPTWPGTSNASPRGYYEDDGGDTLTTYVAPIPTEAGSALERYYIYLGTTLTQTPDVNFTVPDEFVPTVKYGCLAEMLGKVGPAQNLVLSQAAEERWEEGVEMGKLMSQEGWFAL